MLGHRDPACGTGMLEDLVARATATAVELGATLTRVQRDDAVGPIAAAHGAIYGIESADAIVVNAGALTP